MSDKAAKEKTILLAGTLSPRIFRSHLRQLLPLAVTCSHLSATAVTNRDSGRGIGGGLTSTTATNLFSNVAAGVPLTVAGDTKDNLNGYITRGAFTPAPIGTFGNSGRGMFRGPGQWNVDFSTFKDFLLTERFRLQFRTEFFNLFNHANFGNPNTNLDSPDYGTIRSTTVNARLIQFALRLSF